MKFLQRTWAEIDLSAVKHNFEIVKKLADGRKIISIVKADAYGHSAEHIAPLLQENGSDAFAVSNAEEAVKLRSYGVTKPILVLGYTPADAAFMLYENDITQCVYCTEYANDLAKKAHELNLKIKINIKLDTGMGRIGFDCRNDELCGLEKAIKAAKNENFIFGGVFTHFAVADRNPSEEDGFTDAQYKRFYSAVNKFKAAGLNPEICHCCNSAATCLDAEKKLDAVRPGIILYGLTPSDKLDLNLGFKPAMTLKSVVSMVKTIKKGDTVSYGRTFKADRDMKIATVTAGYADGYPRILSNNGYVLINGKKADIIGKICMDQMSVNVSDLDDVKIGDEVILFGPDLPVEILAEKAKTINYEIICGITARVPRIFKK